jgi:phospholipid/cholesterol/gamma-HCH transport system permease protein
LSLPGPHPRLSAQGRVTLAAAARPFEWVGDVLRGGVEGAGEITTLVGRAIRHAVRRPIQARGFVYQVLQVGVRSLPLTVTMSLFAGMVLAFQFGYGLEKFGARLFIGQTTVTALLRELGPILTALVAGGRIGAGIAAELGGMAVTEQIDAVRALGADPLQRLVAPRLVACLIGVPLLTIVADLVGVFGALLVAVLQYDVSPSLFLNGVYDFVTISDFGSGLFKSLVFGFLVGAVACREGMRATGGTEGVGRATTRAVVAGALCVLASDFLVTKLLLTL